jgi:UDP-3-O-acyl N-acetylglucosamine deacetylase
MISGHGNIETAVTATKLGAFDFIEKPFSIDVLLQTVSRALEHRALSARTDLPAAPVGVRSERYGGGLHAGRVRREERTIKRSVVGSGHGLHSGVKSGLILHPLPPGRGIVFASLSNESAVPAHLDYVDSTGYATTLHSGDMTVQTVEHLLATLHAYGVTNLMIKVQSEVPTMDGSAAEFCHLLDSAGCEDQGGHVDEIVISKRLVVGNEQGDGECIVIEPAEAFSVSYTLVYPSPVGRQQYTYVHRGPDSFREEVAPARTFGFLKDMKAMAAMGLASGGRLDNCILIDDEKIVNTTLRFPEEFARHKILDVMGDLYLLGRPIRGRVIARKTGHSDNIALLRLIRKELAS